MFTLDVPDVPTEYAAVVLVQTSHEQSAKKGLDRTVGVCQVVRNPATLPGKPGRILATNGISPIGAVAEYFRIVERRTVSPSGQITIFQNPKHGRLEAVGPGQSVLYYNYIADSGYLGVDQSVFEVEIAGMKVRVVYSIHIVDEVTDQDQSALCPREEWRISGYLSGSSDVPASVYLTPNYTISSLNVSISLPSRAAENRASPKAATARCRIKRINNFAGDDQSA
jgi:hypothetical protein